VLFFSSAAFGSADSITQILRLCMVATIYGTGIMQGTLEANDGKNKCPSAA
jgi:hypothetical protein